MIYGCFHQGSGVGNQLHRYIATRMLARAKKEGFGMIAPDLFKGASFMKLNMGASVMDYHVEAHTGRVVPNIELDILDGEFQNSIIWKGMIHWVRDWLKVEPLHMPDDLCVINFRGGEYKIFPELYLPKEYWDLAVKMMRETNPDMKFVVHTDDLEEAKKFFPDFYIVSDIEDNWRSIRYARYLILSNSSFAILPASIGNADRIIAPKYWARYNTREWINQDNATYNFEYIHHNETE